jgi:hypothetical protein
MKLSHAQRDMALSLIMDPIPAAVRGELVLDPDFCAKLNLNPKFWLTLDADHAAEVVSLHNALRAAIAGRKTATLLLRGGRRIRVKLRRKADNATIIIGKKGFGFSNSDLLSAARKVRVNAFQRIVARQPLLPVEEEKWRGLVQKRALKDREFVDLMTDFAGTPEAFATDFQQPRNFAGDDLMSDSPKYYQRLTVALPGDTDDLDAFIQGPLAVARKELIASHPKPALRRMAFCALWQPLIPFDLLKSLRIEDVAALLDANDPFSLLFGFELCRSLLTTNSQFSDLGSKFLEKLLADKKASDARCNLFSSLAMIAVTKIRSRVKSSNVPLFWLRIAALAHAGVLTDALKGLTDTRGFLKWSTENFYPSYLWTSAVDLQTAPRWNPEWLDPEYLYAELVGRAQGAITLLGQEPPPKRWIEILAIAVERLKTSGKLLAANFPGPLDDFRNTTAMLSSKIDVFKEIEKNLGGASKITDVELFALANASQPSDHVVSHVRRILNGPIEDSIADKHELMYLRLCARIGRMSRDESISISVINRCIFLSRRPKREESLTDIFEVMVEACGANADINKYRAQVGDAAMRLCFAIEDCGDLRNLLAIFDVLSIRDERLAAALGRASFVAKTKSGRQQGA